MDAKQTNWNEVGPVLLAALKAVIAARALYTDSAMYWQITQLVAKVEGQAQ